MDDPRPPLAAFSVVIPAHDEATVVGRCLQGFVPDLAPGEAEVVVVANGCRDDTAAKARGFPGVRVLERTEASKVGALNAGDAACSVFPRIYLDADITVSAAALRAVAAVLPPGVPAVASPTMAVALEGRPWAVRSWYRAFAELPYSRDNLVGLGFYALSAAGRARFGVFPDVTADDLFVSGLFTRGERAVLPGHTFTVQAPRDLRSLVRVRTRVASGNAELPGEPAAGAQAPAAGSSTAATVRALVTLCRNEPRRVPDGVTYLLVTALARWRARGSPGRPWLTDRSTR